MVGRCRFLIVTSILLVANFVPQPAGAQFSQIKPLDVAAVELLIATPSRKSLASVAGHLYLVFRFIKKAKKPPLVLGFEADTRADDEQGVSTLLFSFRGLLGHYRTKIDVEPLGRVIFRSNIIQDRSLYRLHLHLDLNQKKNLLDHINRFQNLEKSEHFYFINQNCTTYIRWLINRVLEKEKRILDLDLVDLPLNVAKKLFQQEVGNFVYPEYWSISRRFFYAQQRNHQIINHFKLMSAKNPVFTFLPGIIDICEKLEFVSDNSARLLLYQILCQRFFTLFDDPGIDLNSRKSLYRMIVAFLFNSRDIERFLTYKGVKDKDRLSTMTDLDSENVIHLTEMIGQCQTYLDSADPGSWHSVLQSFESRRSRMAAAERQASLPMPSYSVIDFQLGVLARAGEWQKDLSYSLKYQVMNQQMGDHSLFAYNRSTAIELLSLRWSAHYPLRRSVAFTVLQFEKVVPRPRLYYKGLFNPGYGFTMFKLNTDPAPGIQSHLKVVDGRFVLGIFEREEFLHFLNLSCGVGLSLTHLESGGQYHALNGLIKLEGKVQLGSWGLRELRFKTVLNHNLNFKEFYYTQLNTELDLGIPLGKRSGILFGIGGKVVYSRLKTTAANAHTHTYFTFYTGLRFSTDRLIGALFR